MLPQGGIDGARSEKFNRQCMQALVDEFLQRIIHKPMLSDA